MNFVNWRYRTIESMLGVTVIAVGILAVWFAVALDAAIVESTALGVVAFVLIIFGADILFDLWKGARQYSDFHKIQQEKVEYDELKCALFRHARDIAGPLLQSGATFDICHKDANGWLNVDALSVDIMIREPIHGSESICRDSVYRVTYAFDEDHRKYTVVGNLWALPTLDDFRGIIHEAKIGECRVAAVPIKADDLKKLVEMIGAVHTG